MHHHSKNPLKLLSTLVLYMSVILTVGGNNVYYIKPSTSGGCPESETCITLSTLAANTSSFLEDTNTVFIFLEGYHTLDMDLNVTNIKHLVRLLATNLVSVSITCTYGAGLNFNNIAQLQISELELIRCRNTIESVGDFLLEECHFLNGDSGSALLLTQTNTNIERCSFTSNTAGTLTYVPYPTKKRVGGALFVTSSNLSISISQFDSNEAQKGGAIFIKTGSNISITDCAFINNRAVSSYGYDDEGGALYVDSDSAVIVHNSTFINNTAVSDGGAVFVYEAVFHDHQNIFHGNRARWGGAIDAYYSMITIDSSSYSNHNTGEGGAVTAQSSSIVMNHSSFYNNEAYYGGAFYSYYSDITAYNISFTNNRAYQSGGAIWSYNKSSIALYYSSFTNNEAVTHGGVILAKYFVDITVYSSTLDSNKAGRRGGVVDIETSDITVCNSSFVNNTVSYYGGVVYAYNGSMTMNYSFIENNKAGDSGGAIRSSHSSIALYYSSFTNNEAVTNGGVILVTHSSDISVYSSSSDSNRAGQYGGVVHVENSYITVLNSSFANNTASCDGGVVYAYDSSMTMNYSSFSDNQAGNDGGVIYETYTHTSLYKSYFMNNEAGNNGGVLYKTNDIIYNNMHTYFRPIEHTSKNISTTLCTFVNNSAVEGGVMYIHDALLTGMSSKYQNNKATSNGGVIFLNKGKIEVTASNFEHNTAVNSGGVASTPIQILQNHITFEKSDFQHNKAFSGGVIAVIANDIVRVSTSMFTNNSAVRGGVVYLLTRNQLTVNHSTFSHNSADSDGGVFYSGDHNRLVLKNSSLTYNRAENNGGVVCSLIQTEFNITGDKCTFDRNQAQNGGAVYASESGVSVHSKSLLISNNSAVESGGAIYLSKTNLTYMNGKSMLTRNTANNGGSLYASKSKLLVGMYSQTTVDTNSATNNGGGLYLTMSELTVRGYGIHINRNRAKRIGGGIFVDNSTLVIERLIYLISNEAENGGGIGLVNSVFNIGISFENVSFNNFSSNRTNGGALFRNSDSNCEIIIMSNNSAEESGGAVYFSKTNLTFVNGKSMLIENTAKNGGSLYASESKLHVGMYSQTTVDTSSATNNGGGLYLTMSELTVRGYRFHINRNRAERIGGGIFADNTSFMIEGATHFANNEAENGGGVSLVNIAIIVGVSAENVSFINFSSNRASSCGGAIHVDDNSNSDTMCSKVTVRNETTSKECFSKSLSFNFSDNSASKLGSNLFGGFLDICEVNETVSSPHREKGVASFLRKSNIDESQLDTISSHPVQLCFCQEGQVDCDYQPETVRVDRGKKFSIEVIAYDQVHNAVNSIVSCSLDSSAGGLDEGQDFQNITTVCTKLSFTLYSPYNYEELTLSVDSTCEALRITEQRVMIEITCSCPIGFQTQNNDQISCDCVCDKVLQPYDKTDCDKQSQSIIRKDNFWINYITSSNSIGYIIYPNCPYDYCHTSDEIVAINLNNPEGYEVQCVSYRSGLLCGSCKQNFSVSLGSSSCLHCPTYWPGIMVTIIIVFILSGICLVALLLVLNITVATGTLNAIIFYANIVAANQSALFSSSKVRFAAILISWLNFDIGFDTCFFDGMDMYIKTWFQIAFPVYIILLVVLIIQLSYYCGAFGRLIGRRDPVATLATLILLSYAKFIQTIITAFSSATLIYPDGSKKNVWLPDASVEYLTGKHAALFFIALLILLAGLLYTVLLLTWQCLLRCPRKRLKLIMSQKLSYFLQTYHVPYTLKHRYWTGLLLLVRVSIYLISGFNPTGDPRISLISTALIMSFCFLYTNMFGVRIYKNWLINAMESITYFNVIAVSILTWYALDSNNKYQTIITNISVGITFNQLLLVVFYHTLKYLTSKLYSRIQETLTIKKVNERLLRREKKEFNYKPIPADGGNHHFNELLDMIDRPVNTNDYNSAQVKPRPSKHTHSEVELPKPYLAPPLPTQLEDIRKEPEVETEQRASEEDHIILREDNHSLHINKHKQCINDYCGINIPEHYNICLADSGTGMECNNKHQLVENSIPNNHITVDVEIHFSMDGGKSVEDETTVTPPIDTDIQQSNPDSKVPESAVSESTV